MSVRKVVPEVFNGFYNCEGLEFIRMVVVFVFIGLAAEIGYDSLLSFLSLQEHGGDTFVTSVGVEFGCCVGKEWTQNWFGNQFLFQLVKRFLVNRAPMPRGVIRL